MAEGNRSRRICNSNNKTVMFEDFKLMVKNIAEDINNLSKLMYMCGMNSTASDRDKVTTLDILWKLEKQGKFAYSNIGPLESLLRDIDRCDLVTKHIEPYRHKYAGEYIITRTSCYTVSHYQTFFYNTTCIILGKVW